LQAVKVKSFPIQGPLLFEPKKHGDDRGFFSEVFREDVFTKHAGAIHFVQDNHSRSAHKGTVRGLHFQRPPFAQGKLVRVTQGAVLDVVVDVRAGSPTFGQHLSVELSAENWRQLWVPEGFLHGFCTLIDDTEFLYKVTNFYSAEHDGAVRWNDPSLGINWPVTGDSAIVSDKDSKAPLLADLPALFPHRK
jgi:dTDP-4-dehydrorhamnose 3,5-epimerase